ncbi:hypothetical protein PAXRUDRAFT_13237 [Paxillus rubicundulus Ve08.2h10]|uniref:Uncharacterized protein n=1 Tax=Paxillus rubicundulus Ve08.2h10 TaxID=930991 RepID=A0A0D0D6L8_9AGAM|nr:hypothetical protein PAXRUDRAFT_13237 [Paxillus rubicundulus Ve08.2h10]
MAPSLLQSNPPVIEPAYQQVPETLCDSFKTEYHPKSGCPPVTESFSTYGQTSAATPPIVDQQPWQPYLSRLDFEFVELTHKAALSKEQTGQFLHLIWKIANGPSKFSFKSHSDVARAWERACMQMTPFEHHAVPIHYKKEELKFDMYTRPLWDWAMDMLQDPLLTPHFVSCSAGEELLKEQGLRPVTNCLWIVCYSNPHEILTFDPLHVDDIGFWGDHLFGQLKQCLNALGHEFEKKLDDQHAAFPHWQNFNHFKSITNISFSDGNKLLDISKQVLYTTQNILTHKQDPGGYALLMCIASYLRYHMYILLDVHMESTLTAGEAEIHVFQKRLEVYIALTKDNGKKWNFPKVHSVKHAFSNIWEKGASRNSSTRSNESQHGPIRRMFLRQTNKRNIGEQILWLDHRTYVAQMICSQIDHLDEEQQRCILDRAALEDDEYETLDTIEIQGHIYLGSSQVPATFAEVEEAGSSNHAFLNVRKKFTLFINSFMASNNIPLPSCTSWLKPSAEDKVHKHCYLKVHYESAVDWKLMTNYLQCNPNFHGQERRDCVLIHMRDKDQTDHNIFACLLFMFKYTVGDITLDLALVQPLDLLTGSRHSVDRDLSLRHFRSRLPVASEFISLQSVICGALLVPDFATHGDFFLVDHIDSDMFLCARGL